MKKIFKILFSLILVISLTGCVKYNVNMEVKDDKSVTLEVIYGMQISSDMMNGFENNSIEDNNSVDESYSTDEDYWIDEDYSTDEDYSAGEDVDVEDYKYLEEKGFKVEEFTEEKDGNTISGVKIIKTYSNIDDITKDKEVVVDFSKMFDAENKASFDDSQFFYKNGNKYVAHFVFDFSSNDGEDYSSYSSMFDMKYTIKLPQKSISNNATSVSEDGKELTWNLKYGEKNDVEFEFSFANNLVFYIIGGIALVLIIVLVVIFVLKKKKKNPNVNNFGTPVVNNASQPVNSVNQPVNAQPVDNVNNDINTPNINGNL